MNKERLFIRYTPGTSNTPYSLYSETTFPFIIFPAASIACSEGGLIGGWAFSEAAREAGLKGEKEKHTHVSRGNDERRTNNGEEEEEREGMIGYRLSGKRRARPGEIDALYIRFACVQ